LGLPCDLLVRGFHLNIFLTVLVSGILCTWPNQLSLWALIQLTIFLCFINLSSSSLVLILHIWFSFVGPNILLKIFLSKTNSSTYTYYVCWQYTRMFTVSSGVWVCSGVDILRGLYSCYCILSRSPHRWIQRTHIASTHNK